MGPIEGNGDVVFQMEELPEMPQPERVGCWGRVFQDWSQYVIAPATAAVGGMAIYEFILPNYAIAGIATAATVALAVSFIRISTLKPRKELEDQVNFFKDQLINLAKQNNRLAHNINELNVTKVLIKESVRDAKATVSLLGEMLEGEEKDFEEIAGRMQVSLEAVQKIAETYKAFNQSLQTLGGEIQRYQEIRKQIAVTVKEFSGEVVELGENESELSEQVDELGENVDEIKENQEELKEQFVQFEEFGKEVQSDVGALKSNVDKLEEMIPKLNVAPAKLDEEYRRLNQSVRELLALVEEGEETLGRKEESNSNNDE